MKKIICVLLVLCLTLVTFVTSIFAESCDLTCNSENEVEASYFVKDDYRTINALLFDDYVNCNIVYQDNPLTVHVVNLQINDEFHSTYSINDWLSYISQAENEIHAHQDTIFRATVDCSNHCSRNTNDDLHYILNSIVGNDYSNSYISSKTQNGITAYLYGNLETDVYFDCELHSPYGATLQAFASLVGVKYTVLGEILGMVAGEIVPTGTGVLRYICVALFSKDGRIGGSTYYDAVHQIIYYGIDYANTSSYTLDNSPISNTYSPSQSIYNSNSTILTNTFNAYLSTL